MTKRESGVSTTTMSRRPITARFGNDPALQLQVAHLAVHKLRLPSTGDDDRLMEVAVAVPLQGGLEIGQAAFATDRLKLFGLLDP